MSGLPPQGDVLKVIAVFGLEPRSFEVDDKLKRRRLFEAQSADRAPFERAPH
jgi:hypothetical protein